jgi:uncharacterized protein (DUF2147 family)
MKIILFFTTVLFTATTAFSAVPGNVTGMWKTDGGDSQLELFRCGTQICGKIIWLKTPNYIDRKDGPVGASKTDRKNPNPSLRNRPILGLQVMSGFTDLGGNKWDNGSSYNPESGKTYKSKLYLASAKRLELRGYVGCSLFGRTLVLTR